jgi:hypothetical protein
MTTGGAPRAEILRTRSALAPASNAKLAMHQLNAGGSRGQLAPDAKP